MNKTMEEIEKLVDALREHCDTTLKNDPFEYSEENSQMETLELDDDILYILDAATGGDLQLRSHIINEAFELYLKRNAH